MTAERFKFSKQSVAWTHEDCFDLDYSSGIYANDGKQSLYVMDQQRSTIHHVAMSNNGSDMRLQINNININYDFDIDDRKGFQNLMYYENCLYLFNQQLTQCIICNCDTFDSYHKQIVHKHQHSMLGTQYLFVCYKHYAIVFVYGATAFVLVMDIDEVEFEGMIVAKRVQVDSGHVFREYLPRAHAIINHTYLLVVNCTHDYKHSNNVNYSGNSSTATVYVICVEDIVTSIQIKNDHGNINFHCNWIKINQPDLIQGLTQLQAETKEIYCLNINGHILFMNKYFGNRKYLLCKLVYDRVTSIKSWNSAEQNISQWKWSIIDRKSSSDYSLMQDLCEIPRSSSSVYTLNPIANTSRNDTNYNYKYNTPYEYAFVLVGNTIVALCPEYTYSKLSTMSIYVARTPLQFSESSSERYIISKKIGLGGSSQVYLGNRVSDNRSIVIKQMDGTSDDHKQAFANDHDSLILNMEQEIYSKLKKNNLSWISCNFYECVRENKRNYLILERLGVSLQHLINEKKGFSNNSTHTVVMNLGQVLGILDRMIIILFKLHSIGYVHNDIKPENILIGTTEEQIRSNQLYLIDFGIATPFWDFKNDKHKTIKTSVPFNGTFRFSSRNHHCNGFSTSRRDDLESLIYLAIYCLTGTLPWMMTNANDSTGSELMTKKSLLEETKRLKQNVPINDVCNGTPPPFEIALIYVQSLKFDEKPNYKYLQQLFRQLHQSELQTQLINTRTLMNINTYVSHKVPINQFRGYWSSLDFLGARCPIFIQNGHSEIDQEHKTAELEFESKEFHQDKYDNDALSLKLTDIAVTQLTKMESNGTITNHPTHMSVHGMRNRFGDLIHSLTINKGVPNKLPRNMHVTYGGIVIYQKSNQSNKLNGQIYMLSSSECEITNKEYTKKTGQQLHGIVHGAIYYHYFKQNIFNASKNNRSSKHKLSFIRGFSVAANGQLKCRSGAFNFIGYKLIDDKYKPLAKCEEKFIDCALKRYWNDNTQTKTTFEQFINWEQYDHEKSKESDSNCKNNEEKIVSHSKLVPNYRDTDVHLIPNEMYCNVCLLWEDNIVQIMDYLSSKDKIRLCCISKQSRLLMKGFCLYKSSSLSTYWYYLCTINHSNSVKSRSKKSNLNSRKKAKMLTSIAINEPSDDDLCESTLSVNFNDWIYSDTRSNGNFKESETRYVVPVYHPCLDIYHSNFENKQNMGSHKLEFDQNFDILLLLKHFGIYDFIKYINNPNHRFYIKGTEYLFQPQWSWGRNGKWMKYDINTCIQIEQAYQKGNESIVLSKGMYSKGQYKKLYKILFDCKYIDLNASNQSEIDDIYNDKKWQRDGFRKYFYQQNVKNKWVRIVRRRMTLSDAEETKNCIIM